MEQHKSLDTAAPALFSVSNLTPDRAPNDKFSSSQFLLTCARREQYLDKLINLEQAPIIILTGAAGVGKTTIMRMLCDALEARVLTRYLPRQKRADDVPSDREWTNVSEKNGTFFAHDMYKGAYAFPIKELVRQIKEMRSDQAILIQIARGYEVPGLVEACQRIFPMTPVLPIRVDAPSSIIERRLLGRTSAEKGEVEERLAAIESLRKNDGAQAGDLELLYSQTTLMSLTHEELTQSAISDRAPLTVETLIPEIAPFINRSRESARLLARDVRAERTLSYGDPLIPDGLTDVLENQLIPATMSLGGIHSFIPALKGGTAMRFYSPLTGRQVSPDIDFTMVKSKFMTMRAEEALERMLREKIEMVDRWDKAQWPAYGAHAVARSQKTGEEIEIDALLVSRVRPLGKGFCYEYHYDAHDNFMRRTVSLPNGGKVYLVPPEHTLMEKLAAGRGAEQGKFDFYDCAGLITQVPLNPSVLRKVISSQRFDGHLLDRDVAQLLIGTSPVKVDDLFEELGILSPRFQQIVHQLGDTFVNEQMGKPQAKRVLSATTIKQIAFVDRCWRMADKIQQDAYLPVNIGPEVVSAAERFGADALTEKVAWLKRFFEHFALFETGRSDVFVRRGSSTDRALESSFFETLELQIERLQKLKS